MSKRASIAILAACQVLAMSLWFSASAVVPQLVAQYGLSGFMQSALTSGVQRYDRYVRDDSFCPTGQYAERAWVPTADVKSCMVYKCKQIDRDDFFFFRRRLH